LAKADPSFVRGSVRDWATAIGCSTGLVNKLSLRITTMEKTGRGRRGRTPAPKAVGLTPKIEATIGTGGRSEDDAPYQLINEQQRDYEPSSAENDPPGRKPVKVRYRKKV